MTVLTGTETEAANLALAHLRQPPIADLADDNPRANAVRAVFAAARDAALRLKWWNFATGYATPAMSLTVGGGDLKKLYVLPADCIEVRSVDGAIADEWEVMAAKADPAGADVDVPVLATSLTAPRICYTRRIEAVRLWSPDFLEAFSFKCAAYAGPQLGASSAKVEKLLAFAEEFADDAGARDAREKARGEVRRDVSFVTARRTGGARPGW